MQLLFKTSKSSKMLCSKQRYDGHVHTVIGIGTVPATVIVIEIGIGTVPATVTGTETWSGNVKQSETG